VLLWLDVALDPAASCPVGPPSQIWDQCHWARSVWLVVPQGSTGLTSSCVGLLYLLWYLLLCTKQYETLTTTYLLSFYTECQQLTEKGRNAFPLS
jgi:hypothetical protein